MKKMSSPVRVRRGFALLCFLTLSLPAIAQVFPEFEYLDVLRLTDGSVLRGHVIEDRTTDYMVIEIYGGSRFVVAYENIESRSVQRNPDYGTDYIRIRIGGDGTPATEATAGEETAEAVERGGRWPDPLWVWPVTIGGGGVTPSASFDGYVNGGGLRVIGETDLYVGGMAHIFFQFPIPYPYPSVGYGPDTAQFLTFAGFLVLPPGAGAPTWIQSGVLGLSVRRVTISAFFAAFDGGVNSIGIAGGYLF